MFLKKSLNLLLVNNFQEIVALYYFNGAVMKALLCHPTCFTEIINNVWSSVMSLHLYFVHKAS